MLLDFPYDTDDNIGFHQQIVHFHQVHVNVQCRINHWGQSVQAISDQVQEQDVEHERRCFFVDCKHQHYLLSESNHQAFPFEMDHFLIETHLHLLEDHSLEDMFRS